MRTDWTGRLVVVLVITLIAAVAWFSHYPESPLLARASGWPVVGVAFERFRAYYLGPTETPSAEADPRAGVTTRSIPTGPARPPADEPIVVHLGPRSTTLRSRVWVPADSILYAEPAAASAVVGRTAALSNLGWSDRQGDWYRVERFTPDGAGDLRGWVLIDDPLADQPTLPPTLEPTVPMAAVAISPTRLAQARAEMSSATPEADCGPYRLVTDVTSQRLAAVCEGVVAAVDEAYAARYGRVPVGAPAETLLVFGSPEAFRRFSAHASRWDIEAAGRASASEGFVALAWSEADGDRLAATLVHELVHLVNRRALGPALPPWLDEGLADDLAEELVGGKYEPAAWQLSMDLAAGDGLTLRRFVAIDVRDFYEQGGYSSYAQALLLVRFLSAHPRLGERFRGFLDHLAAGGTYSAEILREQLGLTWSDLEGDWLAWERSRFLAFGPIDR